MAQELGGSSSLSLSLPSALMCVEDVEDAGPSANGSASSFSWSSLRYWRTSTGVDVGCCHAVKQVEVCDGAVAIGSIFFTCACFAPTYH
jgi:hypothetical protein